MINNFPNWVTGMFVIAVFTAIYLFYISNNKPTKLLICLVVWAMAQSVLAYTGFYLNVTAMPPRFLLVLLPPLIFVGWGLTRKNREWLERNRNMKISTFLHTVRIPVEITLFYLFVHKMVPELMTFEGRNFDILAGITALVIGGLYFRDKLSNQVLLIWNIISLCLVVFILINGLLSSELPVQQFGFDQPNRAVFYFPFVLLPGLIVPIVIYTHITDILLLLKKRK